MNLSRRSRVSEDSGAIQGCEDSMQSITEDLCKNPDRKRLIKIFGLNLGIAAADIIFFSPGLLAIELFGGNALETAFGWTMIFLSSVGIIYGNYRIFAQPDRPVPREEYYTEELIKHRGLKTFEDIINLTIDQIARLEKKDRSIMNILPQTFGDSEITCNKFAAAIAEIKNEFFRNIKAILNKLDTFDEEDYDFAKGNLDAEDVLKSINNDKLSVYNRYVASIKSAAEDNEQILLMLDKLLLGISDLKCPEGGQRQQMTEMIDGLIEQLKYYKK
jgi:hypothetical protein